MDDENVLIFYQQCRTCDLDGLIDTFGDLSDTTSIEMDYAYYTTTTLPNNNSPILEWLLKIDPNIDVDRIVDDYMADEHIPNDALHLACDMGHFEVVKWLLEEEPYLSSFNNRCYLCDAFILSCCTGNLDITKMIFELLIDYIGERLIILNEAYRNATINQNTETMDWLLEIDPNINTCVS